MCDQPFSLSVRLAYTLAYLYGLLCSYWNSERCYSCYVILVHAQHQGKCAWRCTPLVIAEVNWPTDMVECRLLDIDTRCRLLKSTQSLCRVSAQLPTDSDENSSLITADVTRGVWVTDKVLCSGYTELPQLLRKGEWCYANDIRTKHQCIHRNQS